MKKRRAMLLLGFAGLILAPVGLPAASAAKLPSLESNARSGWQETPLQVTLAAPTGDTIRYTTDGSEPTDSFAARSFGGSKDDYDVIDQGELASGTMAAYRTLLGLSHLERAENYAKMKELLDLTEFIDYTLLHMFVGHQDWGFDKNWYAIRRRVDGPAGRFQYFPWDGENVLLDENTNRVRAGGSGGFPSDLHTKLMANAEYRRAFAERVQLHLATPGGALTMEAKIARWKKWQAVLDQPIVAESVRWGDYRRDVPNTQNGPVALYTRENQWLAENRRVVGSYFVHRGDIVLAQLRAAGLYPASTP